MSQASTRWIILLLASLPLITLAAGENEPVELEPVVVIASKTPRPISEVAGQVSIIDAELIEAHLLEDLDGLLRYEPGVNAENSGTRFGTSGVNIRGIGGNRVALEVDGVPLRNRFAVGSYSNGGNNLVDTSRIKRVEILHGPASSLYGSDALGGVMSFTTFDPDDLLARADNGHFYGFRGAWRDEDQSWSATASGAWAAGAHGLLVSASHRDGQEREHNHPGSLAPDPRDWTSRNHVLRYAWDTPSANRLRLTVEEFERDSFTQVNSILGYSRFRNTTSLDGDDEDRTSRILADYEFSSDTWERGVVRAFSTDTRTRQLTRETRATGRNPSDYERYFDYRSKLDGIELNLFRSVFTDRVDHRFGAGVEWLRTRSEEFRDGFQRFHADGSVTRTVLGETMPVRDFPNSTVDETAVFLQDEIGIGDWTIIPAVRWDRYDLDPQPDAIYLEDYPGTPIVEIADSELTSRLGLVRRLNSGWSIYGQFVQGFRAPPHEDANIGFDISLFRYRAIPNPDLRPEHSDGLEFGLRRITAGSMFTLSLFETDFEDFIDSRVPIGTDPESGYLLFQSRNIANARIRGVDVRFEQDLGTWNEALEGFQLTSAVYWSEGDNLDDRQPLNSVSPPQAVAGLSWQSGDHRWAAGLTGTFTRRQDRIDHSAGARPEAPGYSRFDLNAAWRIQPGVTVRSVIRNVTDRHYWRWQDVSGLAAADPMVQLLSQPGRSISLSVDLAW